jgi:hypothetical protein
VDCCPWVRHWNKQAFADWCNLRMFNFWRLSATWRRRPKEFACSCFFQTSHFFPSEV